MKRMINCALFILAIHLNTEGHEHDSVIHPQIGKPCPEFTLANVQYYPKKQVSLQDFKGKWLLLDFWNKDCVSCIRGFPKYNQLQEEFKDNVQFLLVGFTGMVNRQPPVDKQIRALYQKLRDSESLKLSVAFDSSLFYRWDIYAGPLVIIISPDGIVHGITYGGITAQLLNDLIKENIRFLPKMYERDYWGDDNDRVEYNGKLPYLTKGIKVNGVYDTAFLFRSLLLKWTDDYPFNRGDEELADTSRVGRFETFYTELKTLYQLAYFGTARAGFGFIRPGTPEYAKIYRGILIEAKDSSLFEFDNVTGKNRFIYCLKVPPEKSSAKSMMQIMQSDLKNYFPYDAGVETRELPYWRLVVADRKLVESLRATAKGRAAVKDKRQKNVSSKLGYFGIDIPVQTLLNEIIEQNYYNTTLPVLDETGIDFNIDIYLNCIRQNFSDVKRALNENGLDLVEGSKDLQVLVVKDKKNE